MWKDYFKQRPRRRQYNSYGSKTSSEKIAKLAKISFAVVLVGIALLLLSIPIIARDLPAPDKVVRHDGFSTKILDRNGKVLYDIYNNENRIPASFADMPTYLREATISIEDKNFYKHSGFDPVGILRGLLSILFKGQIAGGSTLTQQLVKNVLLTPERTLPRKFKEFILTTQIESKYSKDEILQMYLNEAPYGSTAWGVEAASEMYFGKKVKDLNLVECAFLAGLPQGPTYYSPYSGNSKAYIDRTKAVLRRMTEDGYITSNQEKSADAGISNLSFESQGASFKAPHFVQYVQNILEAKYGAQALQGSGLKITTTLDLDLQDKVQQIVSDEIAKVKSIHITNGAAVVIDPETGEILSMVGSYDFNAKDYDGQFNVSTALRQPGSAIKPFTYVTAFKKGYTPASMIMDVPTVFPGGADQPDYKPVNYDGKYRGPIQLRFALANSINIVAVKMLGLVGIKDVLTTAHDAGITTLAPTEGNLNRLGLSMTLGGGEVRLLDLTDAYSIFMNGGQAVTPISILKVEDKDGKILEENKPQKGNQVVSAQNAYLIANILSDNKARSDVFGLNSLLNIPGREVAVKTGTTNDKRDNWAIGGNDQGVVGVWVGNNDNSPMVQVASGVSGASPIWNDIIKAYLSSKPNVKFKIPDNIVTADVDVISGARSHDGFPSRSEVFLKGTEPSGADSVHVNLKVCKSDGKLATPADVSGNNYDTKEFYVFKEEDPTANGGSNKWQEGILNWLNTQADSKYHPPTDYCGTANPVNVDFSSPHDHDGNLPSTFTIKISADSTTDITSIDLEIDGTKVVTLANLPYEYNTNTLTTGIHTLHATGHDSKGNQSDRTITVGVGVPWTSPSPAPSGL